MKKIISSALIIILSFVANSLSAQQISSNQMRIFQSDNVEDFKKAFPASDLNKCLMIKTNSFDLLGLSVKFEKKNIFDYMLTKTTDINRICTDQSPLMIAARYDKAYMANILMQKGADKRLKNALGETAKDFAIKYQKPALAEIVK